MHHRWPAPRIPKAGEFPPQVTLRTILPLIDFATPLWQDLEFRRREIGLLQRRTAMVAAYGIGSRKFGAPLTSTPPFA
jgi:hypothetical protein